MKQEKTTLTNNYKNLIKDYLTKSSQQKNRVNETIAVLFNKKNKSIGGSRNINPKKTESLVNNFSYDALSENWDDIFSQKSDINYLKFIDEQLLNNQKILSSINRFETYLNYQNKFSKSIPSSWPVRPLNFSQSNSSIELSKKSKLKIQSLLKGDPQDKDVQDSFLDIENLAFTIDDESRSEKSLIIDIKQPMSVVSTSIGIVEKIIQKQNRWNVIIRHEFGFFTYYENLHTINVKKGDIINKMGNIGIIYPDNSGIARTPKKLTSNQKNQLKYRIKIAKKFVNPSSFLVFNY